MSAITEAFGGVTIGQVVLILAAAAALWEGGKKVYSFFSARWHKEEKTKKKEEKTAITLETINFKLNYIEGTLKSVVKRVDVVIDYQKNASGRDFLNLYLRAKDEMADYGCVLLDTFEELCQAYHDHHAAGGNGKTKAMMAEVDTLPKEALEAIMARKRGEKDEQIKKH